MYKKGIRFMVDMHRIYIKPGGVKEKDWYIGAYRMEQQDVEEIIKEWSKEWKNSTVDISDCDEEKEKEKGKEKIGEKKKNKHIGEKQKASQEDPKPHKRQKTKPHKPPTDAQLGSTDYDNIATYVQETLEGSMITIVSAMDMKIAEMKTLMKRALQIPTKTTSTYGTL